MILQYLAQKINDYSQRKYEERFRRFIEQVETEAERVLSIPCAKHIQEMHSNPDIAWRLE
jgi:hypothetical protein